MFTHEITYVNVLLCFTALCFGSISDYCNIIRSSILAIIYMQIEDITSVSVASRTVDELTKITWIRVGTGTVHTTGVVKQSS